MLLNAANKTVNNFQLSIKYQLVLVKQIPKKKNQNLIFKEENTRNL